MKCSFQLPVQPRSSYPKDHDRRKRPDLRQGRKPPLNDGQRTLSDNGLDKIDLFAKLVYEQMSIVKNEYKWSTKLGRAASEALGIKSEKESEKWIHTFKETVRESMDLAINCNETNAKINPLFAQLLSAFVYRHVGGLYQALTLTFMNSIVKEKLPNNGDIWTNHEKLADLKHPYEWFPATRAIQRTVHLHIGPTNSGKTYHALRRLEAAETGVYAGPLRLLAHEVYARLNAKGKLCALMTGEERRIPEGLKHVLSSCTVEMIPVNTKVDVAVIDEIQMIEDEDRGWAWTQAFLGVQAKEVHLCGEERTEDIIKDMCATIGDKLIIHRYQRLSPLELQPKSLRGNIKALEKGDAIILYSRMAIHSMKKKIESVTGRRCAVVYGSLPPETRAQQAALFNDPNNDYDFLAASDAIGMGLNLSVRRIIFESTSKFDGSNHRVLQIPEIKQIAGRAGRYKTAHDVIKQGASDVMDGKSADIVPLVQGSQPNVGYVTSLEPFDLPVVRKAMETNAPIIKAAGIFPPDFMIERFASYFPRNTPFSYILFRLFSVSTTGTRFRLCPAKDLIQVSDIIQGCNLTIKDRITFMKAPVSLNEPGTIELMKEFAQCVANQSDGHLLDIKAMPLDLLDQDVTDHKEGVQGYLRDVEFLHKGITLYLWLSYRFGGVFNCQPLAFHARSLVEQKIEECLDNPGAMKTPQQELVRKIRRAKLIKRKSRTLGEELHPNFEDEEVISSLQDETSMSPDELESSGLQMSPISSKKDPNLWVQNVTHWRSIDLER
ncbi:P-loop containing nucleoside triphosphate hydrolase protein [Bisporella sp. PMI_857]|nr:P-loop containing nucleoside triphosphate hydrolase protein [Bisporella sp. PMI_857]